MATNDAKDGCDKIEYGNEVQDTSMVVRHIFRKKCAEIAAEIKTMPSLDYDSQMACVDRVMKSLAKLDTICAEEAVMRSTLRHCLALANDDAHAHLPEPEAAELETL